MVVKKISSLSKEKNKKNENELNCDKSEEKFFIIERKKNEFNEMD